MERQSSLRKQTKFSRRILCSSRRILPCPMPNEHPETESSFQLLVRFLYFKFLDFVLPTNITTHVYSFVVSRFIKRKTGSHVSISRYAIE